MHNQISKLVSVVIPTFKRPELLRRAICSALDQTYKPIEIIVIDDNSRDYTAVMVSAFRTKNIRYVCHDARRGAAAARNTGINVAHGDYIAFLDDDDEWLPTKLETQLRALQGYDAIVCSSLINGTRPTARYTRREIDLQTLKRGYVGGGTSALLVTSRVARAIKFDDDLPAGQDWDFLIRAAGQFRIRYLDEPGVIFNDRSHARITNATVASSITEVERHMQVLDKHRAYLGEFWYRYHMAGTLLYYVRRRPDVLRHISYTLRRCGVRSVLAHYFFRIYTTRT